MEAADLLPAKLVELLERSAHLYERVDRLDQMLYAGETAAAGLHAQLSKLHAAFGAGDAR